MTRARYLIGFAIVLALALTGQPGPILTAGVVLVLLSTIHRLTT